MKKKILIRVDFDSKIGFGHIIRCCNLAKLLLRYNHEIVIITKSKAQLTFINLKNIKFHFLDKHLSPKKESKLILDFIDKYKFDFLILDLDHNQISIKNYEKLLIGLNPILKTKVICWDNIKSTKFKFYLTYRPYPNLINLKKLPKNQKILQGINNFYFPLKKRKSKSVIKNILINLGGTNQNKLLKKIITKIESIKLLRKLNIIITKNASKKFIKKFKKNNYYYLKFKKPEKLYQNIDFAIVSGGMSKYECCVNCIPFISINLDSTQAIINSKLISMKYAINLNQLDKLSQIMSLYLFDKNFVKKNIDKLKKMRKNYSESKLIKKLIRT